MTQQSVESAGPVGPAGAAGADGAAGATGATGATGPAGSSLGQSRFTANAQQNIAAGVQSKVLFQVAVYDDLAANDTVNHTDFILVAGTYLCIFSADVFSAGAQASEWFNPAFVDGAGTIYQSGQEFLQISNQRYGFQYSGVVRLGANGTICMRVDVAVTSQLQILQPNIPNHQSTTAPTLDIIRLK